MDSDPGSIYRKSRSSLFLYIIAAIFIIIALYFAVKTFISDEKEAGVPVVILVQPGQANAITINGTLPGRTSSMT
jgi:hypothetical protein